MLYFHYVTLFIKFLNFVHPYFFYLLITMVPDVKMTFSAKFTACEKIALAGKVLKDNGCVLILFGQSLICGFTLSQ